jgi:hypothetical protein
LDRAHFAVLPTWLRSSGFDALTRMRTDAASRGVLSGG